MRPPAEGRGAHRRSSELPEFVTLGNTQSAVAEQQHGHRSSHPERALAVGPVSVESRPDVAGCPVAEQQQPDADEEADSHQVAYADQEPHPHQESHPDQVADAHEEPYADEVAEPGP